MVIDTGIFIEHLRAKNKNTTTLYKISNEPELLISAVSIYELFVGATTLQKQQDVIAITKGLPILPFTEIVAIKSAEIYHQLRVKNQMIEFRDIFIAATCLSNAQPIATLNKKHFKRIDGLELILK